MLTKKQLSILGIWEADLFSTFTFKEIKELSRQKSNNVVQIALKEFQKEEIIFKKTIGDVAVYSLNLRNNLTFSYLQIINELALKKQKFPRKILEKVQKKISKHTPFFILIVFGSYAQNKATSKSDLDLAVVVESERTKKEIIPFLETIKRREIKTLDYHIFSIKEFQEMISADYENLGKQIYKKHLIYYGFREYFQLIRGKNDEAELYLLRAEKKK